MSQSRVQDASGACSTRWGRVQDGGHAAPTSWERAKAVPGVWHMPGTVHVPVARPGRVLCVYARDASGTCGTCPGRVQRVPRMWGQRAHHVACIPGAWNTPPTRRTRSAHRTRPGRATGTCTVPGMWHTPGTDSTCSQDAGAVCPPSGTCPRRVEHAPDASHAYTQIATRN